MADLTKNPGDSIDLLLLLQSFGETLGTRYPQAHVYNDKDEEIANSPFDLSHVANNYYSKLKAFQIQDSSATYKIVYIAYDDAGHTVVSADIGEKMDTITVSIQSTTGLGGFGSMKNQQGGDVIVDMDPIFKLVDKIFARLSDHDKKFQTLQGDFDAGLKIELSELNTSEFGKGLIDIKEILSKGDSSSNVISAIADLKKTNNEKSNRIIDAVKKNRSTIIKTKFDKSLMKPILSSVANTSINMSKGLKDMKVDLTKTIDMKNEEAAKMFAEKLKINLEEMIVMMDKLNESIRVKLQFTLQALKSLVMGGRAPKQNINITLKEPKK